MRKILNKMFSNKKLSILIPILIAALIYLLFLFFGTSEDKNRLLLITPIVSALGFFGVFIIVLFQVKNPMCPEWFLNLLELFFTVITGIYSIIGIVSFFASGFQNYDPVICLGLVVFSAVSWAHSKRKTD